MKRNLLIVVVWAVIGCTAGCYTPNNDRYSYREISTDYPSDYPVINMGRPNINLEGMKISGLSFK